MKFWQFVVATTFVLPKIFLSVFIGSRIAMFSDGKRGEMNKSMIQKKIKFYLGSQSLSASKLMNGVSIGGGVALAFASAL